MGELHNIQTYEKIIGEEYQPTFSRFTNVLKRTGLWNDEMKKAFDDFEWRVEDDGMLFSSLMNIGSFKTVFSDIPVRPYIFFYTPALIEGLEENWIICSFLIETSALQNAGKYKHHTYPLIKKLTREMAVEFSETGIYFATEAQDGAEFNGLRLRDRTRLWQFDYALIPQVLNELYSEPPATHNTQVLDNLIEAWDTDLWKEPS